MPAASTAKSIDEAYWDRLWLHDQDVWSSLGDEYVPRMLAHDGTARPVHLKIAENLLRARGDVQILLTGQVGCGKSTELHQLYQDEKVKRTHEVVVLNAATRLNLTRFVDVRMLLVTIGAELAVRILNLAPDEAGSMGFALDQAQAVREWIRVLGRHSELPDPTKVSPRAFLSALSETLIGVPAELKSDDSLREALKKAEVSQVRELVVLLGDELARISGRKVLVIIDDTDKIRDPETTTHLFHNQLGTLRGLPFRWILTMPYALRFDPEAQIPQELVVTLPNVKVVSRSAPGILLDGARQFFQQLLDRLVDSSLIDEAALDRAALYSAGIPREFLRLVHRAFGVANESGAAKVLPSHLELAAAELRRELQPLHADPSVKRQLEHLRLRPDELRPEQRKLMGTLLVVEYTNNAQWYDVHPLLAEEYERRLAARAARRKVARNDIDALVLDLEGEGSADHRAADR